MADENAELGLDIAAQDVTQQAFASVNQNIDSTIGKTKEVGAAAEEMGNISVQHIGHMAHGFETLGNTMEGGSISMRGLTAVVTGGFAAIESSEAMATMGLSLLVAVIIGAIEKLREYWSTEKEEAAKAVEEHNKVTDTITKNSIATLKARGQTEAAAYADNYQELLAAAKKYTDTKNQLEKDGWVDSIEGIKAYRSKVADNENEWLSAKKKYGAQEDRILDDAIAAKTQKENEANIAKINADEASFMNEQELIKRNNTATMNADDAAVANLAITQKEKERELDGSLARQEISQNEYDKRIGNLIHTETLEESALLKQNNTAKQAEADRAYEEMIRKTNANEEQIAEALAKFREKQVETARKASEEMAQGAQSLGIALATGIGKGSEGLKDSLKAVLELGLSMIEKLLYEAEAAAILKGLLTEGVSVAGDVAELVLGTAAIEAAKSAIGSFQTPYGGTRTVPGPSNAMVPAMVHGGEEIGRSGSGSGGNGMTLVVNGHYFESASANAQLFNTMYRYQKRNGLKIQPA